MSRPTAASAAPVAALSDRELKAISALVYEKSGITLHAGKRSLVAARLQKRVRQGGFPSFSRYLEHVKADASGDELTGLLDAIATNHTAFFREPQHFAFLRDVVLPPLVRRRGTPPIAGWSAACATGEEAYTIAITCMDGLGEPAAGRVRLLASDLSTKALKIARTAIYRSERVADVPFEILRRHFEKGLGAQRGTVRIAPPVQRLVDFHRFNLLDMLASGTRFDFIFCRNVMIYFDAAVQQRVVRNLENQLAPGGYLFISHSESLNACRHGLTWVAPAIYRRDQR